MLAGWDPRPVRSGGSTSSGCDGLRRNHAGARYAAIPKSVLDAAEGTSIFPSTVKAGFVFGGHRGTGILSVRDRGTGTWSPPAFLILTGGSFGAQIGGRAGDVVFVIMNRRGLEQLLQNQFKIGAGAAVTAGLVGRGAEVSTDIQLRAEIPSYSRLRGLFAGLTLRGSRALAGLAPAKKD